jgi:exoribonuclease-2
VSIERIKGREGDPLEIGDIWIHIHISSPASFDHVTPNSPADLAARRRASTIYLPHRRYAMFPPSLVQLFTLTPNQPNTALTFSARLDPATGALVDYRVQPSLVNITRVNYYHVEQVLNGSAASDVQSRDLFELHHVAQLRRQYRNSIGARLINLPDPDIKVTRDGDNPQIKLMPNTTPKSRVLVEELMVLAGELAAKLAIERQLPVPLRVQVKPELPEHLALDPIVSAASESMTPLTRLVRELRLLPYSTTASTTAASDVGHYSVGLETYARVTSPIRRYSDLLFQYQYYAQLQGKELPFSSDLLKQLLVQVDVTSYYIHQLQQRCERYWKYKYLAQHSAHHHYYGVVIDVNTPPATWAEFVDTTADPWTLQPRASVFIPAIGLMVHVQLGEVSVPLKATDVVILKSSTNYSQQTFFAFETIVRDNVPTLEEMSAPIKRSSADAVQQ